MGKKIIGIMGAMPEEIESILELMDGIEVARHGGRNFYSGTINGIPCITVFSRWGKVAAATTVSCLINTFAITDLIFIGVAGAVDQNLKIGDIVIAARLIQHDMDASPLMPRYEIPLLGKTYFECDKFHIRTATEGINQILSNGLASFLKEPHIERFSLHSPRVFNGTVASGDQFFSDQTAKDKLKSELPEVLCVEMEGAAVAQVCFEYQVPFIVLRIISDEANEHSSIDFMNFITEISSKYAKEIIKNIFRLPIDSE